MGSITVRSPFIVHWLDPYTYVIHILVYGEVHIIDDFCWCTPTTKINDYGKLEIHHTSFKPRWG